MDAIREQVQACLQFLANQNEDVSRLDAVLSAKLAEQDSLSAAQVVFGARLVLRYQYLLAGVALTVPASEVIDALIEAEKIQAGQVAEAQVELPQIAVSVPPAPDDEQLDKPKKNLNHMYLHRDRLLGDRVVVEFPFDRAKVNALQPLKESVEGWQFDIFHKKEWSYPSGAAAQVIDALAAFPGFEVDPGIAELVGQSRYQDALARELAELEASLLEQERELALEAVYPYLQGKPLADGHPLYQHQREAIRTLIAQQRAVLAHDLGLGKTRAALIAAKAYGLPLLVVAPAGLHITWQREAEAAGVPIGQLLSWAKIPEPPETDYVLIADECHMAQSLNALRTQAFLTLAEQAHAVWPLTGTPMKNAKPINLLPLLIAIRHPLAANRRLYEERYCAGHYRPVGRKQHVYDTSGAAHLDELYLQIKDQVLSKKKEDCLDLPAKTRMARTAETSGPAEKEYQKTLDRLRKEHTRRMQAKREERVQEVIEQLGEERAQINREALAMELAADEENAIAMVEMGILRHAGSLAKVEQTIDLVQEVLDEDGSVVIFTVYRDTADRIAQKLACDVFNGDTPYKERQHMIDQFQARKSRVLVCTYGAGGVGITLTAAQTVILVDRPWTPGDTVQAEDRLHRIGQRSAVTSLWIQYGGLDLRIDALLQQKQERIDQVLLGKRATMGDTPSVRALASEIMASVRDDTPLEMFLAQHGLALPDGSELEVPPALPKAEQPASQAEALPRKPRPVPRVRSLQHSVKADGTHDKRFKGNRTRVRVNVMLDEEVAAFLRSMAVSHQKTTEENGYSGFLEDLVRETEEFVCWQHELRQHGRGEDQALIQSDAQGRTGPGALSKKFGLLSQESLDLLNQIKERDTSLVNLVGQALARERDLALSHQQQAEAARMSRAITARQRGEALGYPAIDTLDLDAGESSWRRYLMNPKVNLDRVFAEIERVAEKIKVLKVKLYLRVENNSKFVRGKSKARDEIERFVLSQWAMEKHENGVEYSLTIPYETDEELERIIERDILQEASSTADLRFCFIEADVQALDGSERSW